MSTTYPPLILSSPPFWIKNLNKQSPKCHIMDNRSGLKRTSYQPPLIPSVVQHWPVIIADVSSLTTKAQFRILNFDDNCSSSDNTYIQPARFIPADYLAKQHQKTLKTLIQNLPHLPQISSYDPLELLVPTPQASYWLPIVFSELNAITLIQICMLLCINSIMGYLVANTNFYAQPQCFAPEMEQQCCWQPVAAPERYISLAIQIHMSLIGLSRKRYWMKDRVYLPNDRLQPAAYLGKTRIQQIHRMFHVFPYISPTETAEGLPCWLWSISS